MTVVAHGGAGPAESDFLVGLAPAHRPALVLALLAMALAAPLVRAWPAWSGAPLPARWAAALLAVAGVIHVGLPVGHHSGPAMTLAFVGSGAAGLWLAWRAVTGRRWRLGAVLLTLATLVAYLASVLGGEEPDQVGLATGLVELAALGLAMIPARGFRRVLANVTLVSVTLVFGTVVWAAFVARHDDHAVAGAAGGHDHGGFLARAQAGILMRPGPAGQSADQRRAADEMVARLRDTLSGYADLRAALAAGYRYSDLARTGLNVHLQHPRHTSDGRIADPRAPEQLVYAIGDGRAVLLGAVFQMPVAHERGPRFGGSVTQWHSHNVCLTLLPFGIGPVSPYGTCPFLGVAITIGEMLHVWTVDNPRGAYADALDDAWVRDLLAREGRPM